MDTDTVIKYGVTILTWIALLIILPSSLICMIIHLYKFFRSNNTQSLATKNLTFYCMFLLLFYACYSVYTAALFFGFFETFYSFNTVTIHLYAITSYLEFNMTFVKFIIAIDICLCFRKISVHLQRSSGSQNKKFFVYCLLGVCLPMVYTIFQTILFHERNVTKATNNTVVVYINHSNYEIETVILNKLPLTIAIIRIIRLIPIFGAFWYLVSASIDKKELWTRFSVHIRLIIMIGGFSTILTVIDLIFANYRVGKRYRVDDIYSLLDDIGIMMEGIVVGVCFTFKKDTFQSLPTTTRVTPHTKTTNTTANSSC